MYWGKSDDVAVPLVSQRMSRNRFRDVKWYLHIVNNSSLDKADRIAKFRPLIALANKSLQQFGIFHENLSIDESMVPYFVHHSCKMFIQRKPIRFGYKLWCLCSSNGYPYIFDMYSGKCASEDSQPLGTRVVGKKLSCVNDYRYHRVFFTTFSIRMISRSHYRREIWEQLEQLGKTNWKNNHWLIQSWWKKKSVVCMNLIIMANYLQ